MRSSSSSLMSSMVLQRWIPALATTQFRLPKRRHMASTALSRSCRFRVLPSTNRTPSSFASFSPSSRLMSIKATCHPSFANLRTQAAPIPVEPPVMNTVFKVSLFIAHPLFSLTWCKHDAPVAAQSLNTAIIGSLGFSGKETAGNAFIMIPMMCNTGTAFSMPRTVIGTGTGSRIVTTHVCFSLVEYSLSCQ